MKAVIALIVAVIGTTAATSAVAGCNGTPNTIPVYTDEPTFVSSMLGGSKWKVGPSDLGPQLSIIHMYGSAYQMGQQYGALLHNEINTLVPQVFQYIYNEIGNYIKFLPKEIQKAIEVGGVDLALNLTIDATRPHTPKHFYDTIDGMSNTTGIPSHTILQMALFPELIKASCSMFGAWGKATAQTDQSLVQLRALDWTTDGPFQQFPVILVYHPENGDGHAFAAMSWAGLVGTITGYSSAKVGISEKVWDAYSELQNIIGYPFHFLLQDILQYDIDTDQALSRIATANRTCAIWIGIGDYYNMEFKAVQYSYETVNIFNPRNFPVYENHDRFDDLVFVDKHVQPSHDPCLNNLLHDYYGKIDTQNTLQYITSQLQTGDMHIAIYDFEHDLMTVSNASPANAQGKCTPAYDRPFIQLNMTALFDQQ